MKVIPLTKDSSTKVDDEDYDYLMQWRWDGSSGYAKRGHKYKEDGKFKSGTILMHRVIMNAPKGVWVDHINGDPLDNQRENLRFCTPSQNFRNQAVAKNSKSGYKGVTKSGKKWRAMIMRDGKNRHIGSYRTKLQAARAYDAIAHEIDPEFYALNESNQKRLAL